MCLANQQFRRKQCTGKAIIDNKVAITDNFNKDQKVDLISWCDIKTSTDLENKLTKVK